MVDEQPCTVVVGVSATSRYPTALAWADAQAWQNDGRIIAVRAWTMPSPQAVPSATPAGRIAVEADVEREAQTSLERDVAATLGEDHQAELRLVRGGTLRVLTKAVVGADLLDVDAPRKLLVLPMFAHRLLHAAPCPLVVLPHLSSGSQPSKLSRAAESFGRRVVTAVGTGWSTGLPAATEPLTPCS